MIRNSFKALLYVLLLILLPLVLASFAGAIYIGVQLIIGIELSKAVHALTQLIRTIFPYLPHITSIPALFVLLALIVKNRKRIKRWLKTSAD